MTDIDTLPEDAREPLLAAMRKTVVTDRTVAGALQTRSVGWPIGDPSILCPDDESCAPLLYRTLERYRSPHTTYTL